MQARRLRLASQGVEKGGATRLQLECGVSHVHEFKSRTEQWSMYYSFHYRAYVLRVLSIIMIYAIHHLMRLLHQTLQ